MVSRETSDEVVSLQIVTPRSGPAEAPSALVGTRRESNPYRCEDNFDAAPNLFCLRRRYKHETQNETSAHPVAIKFANSRVLEDGWHTDTLA